MDVRRLLACCAGTLAVVAGIHCGNGAAPTGGAGTGPVGGPPPAGAKHLKMNVGGSAPMVCRFEGDGGGLDGVRIAAGEAGLASAPVTKASGRSERGDRWTFPPVRVPLEGDLGRIGDVQMSSTVWRSDRGFACVPSFIRTMPSDTGSYAFTVSAAGQGLADSVAAAPTLDMARLKQALRMEIVAKPSADGAMGIGIRLSVADGFGQVSSVAKNGEPISARVLVKDEAGKTLATEFGTLSQFGFG